LIINKLFNALLFGLLLLFATELAAQGKAFKIELIVFAQDQATSETFDQTDSAIKWPSRLAALGSYHQVASEHRSLHGVYTRLQQSASYRPLMHVAWTQSISENSLGRAVQLQNTSGTLDGYFRLQRGHVLHLITDLEYRPKGRVIYRLNEKRRFKFNEIHYLDHPKFGVVVRVSPLS
jgi:peptidoglycan-binding protein CsiV